MFIVSFKCRPASAYPEAWQAGTNTPAFNAFERIGATFITHMDDQTRDIKGSWKLMYGAWIGHSFRLKSLATALDFNSPIGLLHYMIVSYLCDGAAIPEAFQKFQDSLEKCRQAAGNLNKISKLNCVEWFVVRQLGEQLDALTDFEISDLDYLALQRWMDNMMAIKM